MSGLTRFFSGSIKGSRDHPSRGIFRRGYRQFFLSLFFSVAIPGFVAAETTLDIPVADRGYGLSFYQESARLFEAARPGVKVNVYGDPRIEDKIRVRVIDGDYPDATFTPYLLWPALIRAGRVIDLSPALSGPNWEGDTKWGDTFLPGALDGWRVNGRIYGVPVSYACWTIFYNRALFRTHGWTEPRTWDEFFALCAQMKAAGIAPLSVTGLYGNYPDAFLRAAYYNLAGADAWRGLNELAPGARTDPRYVRAAALLQRVMQECTLAGWEGATHTSAQLAFLEGRAAMTVSGSWMLHEMEGKIPPDFEIGAMNFPVFPDGVADPATIQVGADWFFVFATGHPERERLTLDFLRFLTSRVRAEAFVRRMDSPAAVRGVPPSAFSPRMRETYMLIEHAPAAFAMPQVMLQPPATRQATIDGRLDLMTGHITPEQFGARTEAAAAHDRARLADPDQVESTHFAAGILLLLALVAAALALLLWKKRESDAPPASRHLARLRGPVALGFVGPSFLLYSALVLLPGLSAFAWAFTAWDGMSAQRYVGLLNFRWLLFESDGFWAALGNNAFLMVMPALVVVPLALLFATLIHRGVWGAKLFRVCFLFPNILGGIAATLLWMQAYEPHNGMVNAGLVRLGGASATLGLQQLGGWLQSFDNYAWLSQQNLYHALIPIYIWMACGFNLVLYLAAMEGIDPELYEAAELDGAPPWRQFFTITLPLLREVLAISAVFLVIGGLNTFELIWLLTSQDPTTGNHVLGTLMVSTMFKDFQIGRATAVAVMMFILVFLGSAVALRLTRRQESA